VNSSTLSDFLRTELNYQSRHVVLAAHAESKVAKLDWHIVRVSDFVQREAFKSAAKAYLLANQSYITFTFLKQFSHVLDSVIV
jgi:hypothetical protein